MLPIIIVSSVCDIIPRIDKNQFEETTQIVVQRKRRIDVIDLSKK